MELCFTRGVEMVGKLDIYSCSTCGRVWVVFFLLRVCCGMRSDSCPFFGGGVCREEHCFLRNVIYLYFTRAGANFAIPLYPPLSFSFIIVVGAFDSTSVLLPSWSRMRMYIVVVLSFLLIASVSAVLFLLRILPRCMPSHTR